MSDTEIQRRFWDEFYGEGKDGVLVARDPWFLEFLPPTGRVLDIGCGDGSDAELLQEMGYEVVATDFSDEALRLFSSRLPEVRAVRCELDAVRSHLTNERFDAVLADCCLHYFHWRQTVLSVSRIASLLLPGAPLIYRVNSQDDTGFGAQDGEEVEPGLRRMPNGCLKRFFSHQDARDLFCEAGFEKVMVRSATTDRFGGKVKHVLEGYARKLHHQGNARA